MLRSRDWRKKSLHAELRGLPQGRFGTTTIWRNCSACPPPFFFLIHATVDTRHRKKMRECKSFFHDVKKKSKHSKSWCRVKPCHVSRIPRSPHLGVASENISSQGRFPLLSVLRYPRSAALRLIIYALFPLDLASQLYLFGQTFFFWRRLVVCHAECRWYLTDRYGRSFTNARIGMVSWSEFKETVDVTLLPCVLFSTGLIWMRFLGACQPCGTIVHNDTGYKDKRAKLKICRESDTNLERSEQ